MDQQVNSYDTLLLLNAKVLLLKQRKLETTNVLITNSRFVAVGNHLNPEGNMRVEDLKGQTLLPGLVDCHGHLHALGKKIDNLNLDGVYSADELVNMVKHVLKNKLPGEWVLGRGWDHTVFKNPVFPDRTELDKISGENPVYLTRIDGHAVLVNKRTLDMAGIDENTSDPPGGKILRFPNTTIPSGILLDNAILLVDKFMPSPSKEKIGEQLLKGAKLCMDVGLTGVHDAGITMETWEILKKLVHESKWVLPVYGMLWAPPGELGYLLDNFKPESIPGKSLYLRAVKIYVDGSLGSRSAALLAPYSDDPGNMGIVTISREELKSLTSKCLDKGFQPCFHAIGDRAVKIVIDVLEKLENKYDIKNSRIRIEHMQVAQPNDIQRMAKLNLIASIQPGHLVADMGWTLARLGSSRMDLAFPWHLLRKSGVKTVFGSDFPIDPHNPFHVLKVAMTGSGKSRETPPGWNLENLFEPFTAFESVTSNAAYASFQDNDLGFIEPGKRANCTIVPWEPVEQDKDTVSSFKPTGVIINGKIFFT